MHIITVSAVLFQRLDGTVLTVRKRGTDMFMLPGGKPESGESAADCARREVREELGITLEPADIEPFGTWDAAAANEAGATVRASVFRASEAASAAVPRAQAEIEELRWIHPVAGIDDPAEAPLNRDHVFPMLIT
ncbi:NUDIX domain-containing protein [uncultured Agrococcus sp.]|uniref:NUDIX hydrolase n=1 Tax=uncultured Agrococcus sp. TaxID=382258 RepID=UPI0025F35861|nr:NUDIX domain-containing protein [uncultured Agrococcus sp.]